MSSPPMISTQILLPVIERLRERGYRAGALLENLDIDRALLDDVNAVVALEKYIAFFESAADLIGDPHFGLKVGKSFTADNLGVLGFLFDSAPTLKDALVGLSRYLGALQEGTRMSLTPHDDLIQFEYQILQSRISPRRQDSEYSMAATLELIRRYVGPQFTPLEVSFEHDRIGRHSFYEHHFGCHVFFQQSTNYIQFHKETLAVGSPTVSDKLFPIIASHLSGLMKGKGTPLSVVEQVRDLLSPETLEGGVSLSEIATELDISTSTLTRRLKQEGTSFHEILAGKRMNLAKRLLTDSESTISQIALRTGYSENASFTRAFKARFGKTPNQYRRRVD